MFYSPGDVSASSGRKKRQGQHNRHSTQSVTSIERVLPGRSKAHTPNAPSERVEPSRTTTGRIPDKRKEEELLNETESIAEDLYIQYTVALTKYRCLVRLRAEAIGCLKAQQDVESSSRYVEKVKESIKAAQREAKGGKGTGTGITEAGQDGPTPEDLKKAEEYKVKAGLARAASFKRLHEAHREVARHNKDGFCAGRKSPGKPEDAIEAFSRYVYLTLTKSPLFSSIQALSILNHAVGALDELRGTYSCKDILKLKSEIEQLIKEHRELQRQDQPNNKQGIRDLDQHHLLVEKLHEIAEKIRDQELKDPRRRYNLIDELNRQMTELEDLEHSLPEEKVGLLP